MSNTILVDNNIEGFEGWDEGPEMDLFTQANTELEEPKKKVDLEEEELPVNTDPDTDTEDNKPSDPKVEEDLFATVTSEEVEEEEDEEEDEDLIQGTKISSSQMLKVLKERGLVEYEMEDGVELDDSTADAILEDSMEQRFDAMLEEKMASLDPSVKEIVKYNIKGGNFRDLLSKMAPKGGISVTADMDLDSEENQIALIKRDRLEKGDDAETVEDYAQYLKESGKLKGIAEKLHANFLEQDKNIAKQETERLKQKALKDKEAQRELKNDLSTFIADTKNYTEVKLTPKETREFPSYIADTNVELEDGRKISQLHRDLFLALKDKKKVVLLAKILKDDFNFDQIGKTEKTKQVGNIKKTLQTGNTITKRSKPKQRSLADMLG